MTTMHDTSGRRDTDMARIFPFFIFRFSHFVTILFFPHLVRPFPTCILIPIDQRSVFYSRARTMPHFFPSPGVSPFLWLYLLNSSPVD